ADAGAGRNGGADGIPQPAARRVPQARSPRGRAAAPLLFREDVLQGDLRGARYAAELGVAAPDPREGEAEEAAGIAVLSGEGSPTELIDGLPESGTVGRLRARRGKRPARRRGARPRLPGVRDGAADGPRSAGGAAREGRAPGHRPPPRGAAEEQRLLD